MKKVKEFIKKNKKWVIISLSSIIVLIVGIFLVIHLIKPSEQEVLKGYLKDMGKDFYENAFYDKTGGNLETKTEFLKGYSKIGITVDLENLGIYDGKKNGEIVKKFVNSKTKKACDNKKTKVIIYPKSPFGKKDYELNVMLSCGFKED